MTFIRPFIVFLVCVLPMTAWAQQSQAPANVQQPKWEVEGFAGMPAGRFHSGGTLTLPDPGAPITTSSPVFPSWNVPSWFFGDGAAFLNNVATELGLTNRILPLEGLLESLGDHLPQGVLFGVRVRRALPASYALEFGIEVVARKAPETGLQSDLVEAAQPYADSFTSTFRELLAANPFTMPTATVSAAAATNSTRETVVTAAVNADAKKIGGVVPYVTMGGGIVIPSDTPQSSLAMTGAYQFRVNSTFPFDETDRVEIGFKQKTAFVAVIGGGVRWDVSHNWGVRGDVRFLIGPSTTTVTISATPTVISAIPAAFIESFTYPNLQFSNNASTGRVSTLGGPGLSDFDTFKGGWETRGRVTGGLFLKF